MREWLPALAAMLSASRLVAFPRWLARIAPANIWS